MDELRRRRVNLGSTGIEEVGVGQAVMCCLTVQPSSVSSFTVANIFSLFYIEVLEALVLIKCS